jgi:hypothetical protein
MSMGPLQIMTTGLRLFQGNKSTSTMARGLARTLICLIKRKKKPARPRRQMSKGDASAAATRPSSRTLYNGCVNVAVCHLPRRHRLQSLLPASLAHRRPRRLLALRLLYRRREDIRHRLLAGSQHQHKPQSKLQALVPVYPTYSNGHLHRL